MKIHVTTFDLLLRKRGLTQAALADRARIGVKTVGRIRRGEELRASNAEKIAAVLGVSVDVLEAPPTDELAEKASKSLGLQRIVADLDTASVNALMLTSMRYGIDEKWILEASPYLFNIIAELSLKRRRDKIEAWKDAAVGAAQNCPRPHASWATVDSVTEAIWDLYHEEIASIERRDLSGGFEGDHPETPDAENPGNAFLETITNLASEGGNDVNFTGCSFNVAPTPFWDEILFWTLEELLVDDELEQNPEAVTWNDRDAVYGSIMEGKFALRDMPEELLKSGSAWDRWAWLCQQPPIKAYWHSLHVATNDEFPRAAGASADASSVGDADA